LDTEWDVVVIGSGPGGYVAALRASQLGLKTAVVEEEHIGGVCLNWGCVPTKALIHSASLYRSTKSAKQYGVSVPSVEADLSAIVRYSRTAASRISKGVEYLLRNAGVEVLWGRGRFVDLDEVAVTDAKGTTTNHRARGIVIATGGRPIVIPGTENAGHLLMDVRRAMTPTSLPKRLIVIGGGAIGVEFAYIYACLGTRVTIVEMLESLLPQADHEIGEELRKAFRRLSIEVLVSTKLVGVKREGDSVRAVLSREQENVTVKADAILVAVGVRPNSADLGLEDIGVETERGFIAVDRKCSTGVGNIYAIGDVTGGQLLAHKASAQGIAAAEALAGIDRDRVDLSLVPACCYCEPQVAQVGPTERELEASDVSFSVGRFPFAANAKATATGHRVGMVKLLFAEEDDRLLAAHLIGPGVSEMIAELALAAREGVTAERLGRLIHPHPSLSEALMEAAEAAHGKAIHV
jgi:dihydrolipoamide dehydrogenase